MPRPETGQNLLEVNFARKLASQILSLDYQQLKHQHMDVSENSGTPNSSILIGFSIINHPFWGTPIFGNTHIQIPRTINTKEIL